MTRLEKALATIFVVAWTAILAAGLAIFGG